MLNLNRVEVIGNLTRDPELRYTPSGQAVASFAIATNRRYRDDTGNWIDSPPEYHEVVVWSKLGEGANQILKKGMRVYAAGRQQTRSWEGQDGNKRYKTELVVDTIIGPDQVNKAAYSGQFAGSPVQQPTASAEGGNSQQPTATPAPSDEPSSQPATPSAQTPVEDEINIEDIPF